MFFFSVLCIRILIGVVFLSVAGCRPMWNELIIFVPYSILYRDQPELKKRKYKSKRDDGKSSISSSVAQHVVAEAEKRYSFSFSFFLFYWSFFVNFPSSFSRYLYQRLIATFHVYVPETRFFGCFL